MITRALAVLLASLSLGAFLPSSARADAAAPVGPTYQCGEAFDRKAVGNTFSGVAKWDTLSAFYVSFTFDADCRVTSRTNGGPPRTAGQWGQPNASQILWQPADTGAVYQGDFHADGSIRGVMAGPGGYKGTFTLRPETVSAGDPATCNRVGAEEAVAGKTYSGSARWDIGVQWNWMVTFNADCTVTDKVDSGNTKLFGQWAQTPGSIVWRNADRTAEYRGTLQADGSIRGTITNLKGDKGEFTLRPKP